MPTGEELVGQVGEVVLRVRGEAGPGEVRVWLHGSYDTLIAYSTAVIERGRAALVVDYRGAGSVDVVPWDTDSPLPGPGR